jgi:hypothetical protein
MPVKLEWSQCIQLFSYMEWNPLLYLSDGSESRVCPVGIESTDQLQSL